MAEQSDNPRNIAKTHYRYRAKTSLQQSWTAPDSTRQHSVSPRQRSYSVPKVYPHSLSSPKTHYIHWIPLARAQELHKNPNLPESLQIYQKLSKLSRIAKNCPVIFLQLSCESPRCPHKGITWSEYWFALCFSGHRRILSLHIVYLDVSILHLPSFKYKRPI